MSPRTGRRVGESGTRQAILTAARRRFAEVGYDAATIRAIAGDASVDPALVHHFYGTKEGLFVAAVGFPAVPGDIVAAAMQAPASRRGEAMVRALIAAWDSPDGRDRLRALLRSALANEAAMVMLREFLASAVIDQIAGRVHRPNAAYRASLIASQVVGLAVARYVIALPGLAEASVDDLSEAIGPVLQRYLTGPVQGPTREPSEGKDGRGGRRGKGSFGPTTPGPVPVT